MLIKNIVYLPWRKPFNLGNFGGEKRQLRDSFYRDKKFFVKFLPVIQSIVKCSSIYRKGMKKDIFGPGPSISTVNHFMATLNGPGIFRANTF